MPYYSRGAYIAARDFVDNRRSSNFILKTQAEVYSELGLWISYQTIKKWIGSEAQAEGHSVMLQTRGNITLRRYRCPEGHDLTLSYRGTIGREGLVVICEKHERYCEPTGEIATVTAEEVSKVRSSWGSN